MKLSLRDSLCQAWRADRRLRFYDLEGMTESMTFGEFGEKVAELQAGLEALGVGPGTVVAVMGPTSPSIAALCAAIWQAEATLTVLATPTRLSNLEQYLAETLGKLSRSRASILIAWHAALQVLMARCISRFNHFWNTAAAPLCQLMPRYLRRHAL